MLAVGLFALLLAAAQALLRLVGVATLLLPPGYGIGLWAETLGFGFGFGLASLSG